MPFHLSRATNLLHESSETQAIFYGSRSRRGAGLRGPILDLRPAVPRSTTSCAGHTRDRARSAGFRHPASLAIQGGSTHGGESWNCRTQSRTLDSEGVRSRGSRPAPAPHRGRQAYSISTARGSRQSPPAPSRRAAQPRRARRRLPLVAGGLLRGAREPRLHPSRRPRRRRRRAR